MAVKKLTATPLDLGKELEVFKGQLTGSGTDSYIFSSDADAIAASLYVVSTSGDVTVNVYTMGEDGHEVSIIEFPTVSAPTTELLLRKSAQTLRRIRVEITWTGDAYVSVRARGASAAASSVLIEGASNFRVGQKDITTTAEALINAALEDRRGILIKNNNNGSNEVLYIAETLAKAVSGIAFPLLPGENLTVDLQAGSEVFAVSSTGTVDVRIFEIGNV